MKTIRYIQSKICFSLVLAFIIFSSCDRELSEDAIPATFPTTAEIYIDDPVGLTDQFFRSFDPASGANTNGFGVDNIIFYEGSSSIRIDVPASNDPDGNFIGGVFEDRGEGRNLTGYDALTFWAKGTTSGTVEVGFGTDFDRLPSDPSYAVSTTIQMTSGWKKYIIPIPDPSKLVQETGMFLFSAGGFDPLGDGPNGNEIAWTFWIDELKFERTGTVAQAQPSILNGQDISIPSFTGNEFSLLPFTQTLNVNGTDVTVNASPFYFDFTSSDPTVASVTDQGVVTVNGAGTTSVIASLAGVRALGSLEITSSGVLPSAPIPMVPDANVKSVFSDAYTNNTSSNFSPGFGGSTTQVSVVTSNNDSFLSYTNNNFTGIIFDNTVDASAQTFMHVDVYVQNAGTEVELQIRDIGANGILETDIFTGNPSGDDADKRFTATGLIPGQWVSFDIPLDAGLATQKNNLGAIILVGGPDFILDNIYFFTP